MPNRKLAGYGGGVRNVQESDDEPEPEPEEPDVSCAECGSTNVPYADPSEHDGDLPAKPLCRKHLLDRL